MIDLEGWVPERLEVSLPTLYLSHRLLAIFSMLAKWKSLCQILLTVYRSPAIAWLKSFLLNRAAECLVICC